MHGIHRQDESLDWIRVEAIATVELDEVNRNGLAMRCPMIQSQMVQFPRIQPMKDSMLQRFGRWLESLAQPVHVEQRRDRSGRLYYWAIDRQTGDRFWADSETELRAWLEGRYDR
jgi:hypothetical protein